ncbi:MAG: M23 family metallopeptidase [Xanthobacteraceae bacterium]|nr:M23 family metallopeptidase [Xanthobacteraceae bacterium]
MTPECPVPLAAAVLSAALLLPGADGTRAADPISLALPVACEIGKTCFLQNYVDADTSAKWQDYRCGAQTYDGHDGTDIRVPSMDEQRAGVDVIAAAPGTVIATRDGVADVSIREGTRESIKGRECGNGVALRHDGGWVTQYCHMAKDSIRVSRGQKVENGTPLGRIGLSGNTEFPHLHFSVRHGETKVDPFAYDAKEGSCGSGQSLWNEAARAALSYRRGEVINAGFAGTSVTMAQIESGEARRQPPNASSPALVAYVRAIGLEAGDVLELSIVAPDGKPFAQQRQPPLDHSKAQFFAMVGKKRGQMPWPAGTYTAKYNVLRDGQSVLDKSFTFDLPPG